MVEIPEKLQNYINAGKKVNDLSEIYNEILTWLDSDKSNYLLTIGKFIELCNYFLDHIDISGQISAHLSYIAPDVLSIIYERSSKYLKFPENCYCKADNPFIGMDNYNLESLFWDLFRKFSIKVAYKCSSKEGYVVFVEIILGTVSLPVTLTSDDNLENENKGDVESSLNSLSLFQKKKELPRFYRYLGLHCSLICISRMKRNKAQFITTVCSLTLRKFIYDIECNSLYICSCNGITDGSLNYCIIAEIQFLDYLVNQIIQLLMECLTECRCDAEYKSQEIGLFHSISSENSINVTQHAIYSFLMKILEKLILVDIHDIEIVPNIDLKVYKGRMNKDCVLKSNFSSEKIFSSIINQVFSDNFYFKNHYSSNQKIIEWVEIIYKICYYITLVAPQVIINILSHMPICIYDLESQPGDLDVTPLSLACYSYALFVILENNYSTKTNIIYPKFMISLPFKLNIIYRTISVFLTYGDTYKYGYEINYEKKSDDILLSYFNTFVQKSISTNHELILKFHNLLCNRLQDKAYYLLESNFENLLKCKKLIPDSFETVFGLDWHQNILIKQIMFSFTRNRNDNIAIKYNLSENSIYYNQNLYSHLFEKLTISLNECYNYKQLFNIYFNIMEFQKNLFSFNNSHSVNIILGLLNKIRDIWWEEINIKNDHQVITLKRDLNRIILFCFNYLKEFNMIDNNLTQSDVLSLIILNFIKLILLSYLNGKGSHLKIIFDFLMNESNVLEDYLNLIKICFNDEIKFQGRAPSILLFIIKDIENILNNEFYKL